MLERFLRSFPVTEGPPLSGSQSLSPKRLVAAAGGRSFAGGLYRTHTVESSAGLLEQIDAAFPEAPQHTAPYGYDWLGRQFCAQADSEDALTLMFEPGTGEILEIPVPFASLHDDELVEYRNEALASDFFSSYLAAGGQAPNLTQCVGYRTPLLLGGHDTVPNLELTDMDVYWHISGQLIARAKGLTEGTRLDSVSPD